MYRKILLSMALILLLVSGVQASPLPFSIASSADVTVGNDANLRPNASKNGYTLEISDIGNKRRVTLISFDISSLKGGLKLFSNVSLSNMGIYGGKVDVYGVLEDKDNITESATWNSAPGVKAAPIGYPVTLNAADLTDVLLTFDAPANNQRASTGASQALTDFVNSDTDGIVTLLFAPVLKSPFLPVRKYCEPCPPPPLVPPTPNPMAWATDPYITSISTIVMKAATATSGDGSGVEYYFECLTEGGHSSGWQDSPDYTDVDVAPDTTYEYQVKARNKGDLAETEFSPIGTATTLEKYVPDAGATDVTLVSSLYPGGGTLLEGEITTGLNVIVVTEESDRDGDGVYDDQGLVDWLDAETHNVDARRGYWMDLDPNKVAELDAADLVIISRATNSGNYNGDGEPDMWNSVTAPMINMTAYLTRNSRWKWMDNATIASPGAPIMQAVEPISSVVFDGIELDPETLMVDVLDPLVGSADPNDPNVTGNTSFLMSTDVGNGRLMAVAQTTEGEAAWIATWLPRVEYYPGSGQFAGGMRMAFMAGTQEPPVQGAFNLNATGQKMLANAIILMVQGPVDPGTDNLLAYYSLDGDVSDDSGNGNDGTIIGDPGFVEGVVGNAIDLNGDDYIDCGNNPLFGMQETNQMTVAAWVTIRSIPTAWIAAVAKGEYAWRLSNVNMDPRFHFGITIWNAPDAFGIDGVTAVGLDEWHHIAGTFDGTNINVWLDGVVDAMAKTTEPIGTNALNVFIGENPESLGRFWDGLIDEVYIYNRALSYPEIQFLAGQ